MDPYQPNEADYHQFCCIRQEMISDRMCEVIGRPVDPDELMERVKMYVLEDGRVYVITLDDVPVLQMEGPVTENGFACIWRTANFRTIPKDATPCT